MRKYLVRRILQMIPLLLGVSVVAFVVMRLAPGDPVAIFINPEKASSPEMVELIRHQLGLDKPMYVQYLLWLKNVLHGDWGYSYVSQKPVMSDILVRLPNTLLLGGVALAITLLVSIPVGVFSAVRSYTAWDYAVTLFAFLGLSIPSFWFGLSLMQIFANHLHWLPSVGMHSIDIEPGDPGYYLDVVKHMIMPAIVLSLSSMATLTRYQRSSVLEVIRQNYIQTARAKGLPERVVIYKHALKNAMVPVITMIGLLVPQFVGGSYITETVFGWPGIGRLGVNAIFQRDYAVVMGVTMLSALIIVVANLLTDVAYAVVNPRIRYE